jgi:hypothetical protein
MSRLLALVLVALLALGAACSGDDDVDDATEASSSSDGGGDADRPDVRFCDAYLGYLGDPSDENLDVVVESADDEEVGAYADIMRSDADITAVVAATLDLEDLARSECQAEWTAGAQGAGNAPAAAQAFLDALLARDPIGARNVASANAIAVFEPWEQLVIDPDAGFPAIGDVDDRAFTIILDAGAIAECQVETGVVVACQIAR